MVNGADSVDNTRHEADIDPFPASATEPTVPLNVDIEDAKRHLALLVRRSESGEAIVLTRQGHPVARIVAIVP